MTRSPEPAAVRRRTLSLERKLPLRPSAEMHAIRDDDRQRQQQHHPHLPHAGAGARHHDSSR